MKEQILFINTDKKTLIILEKAYNFIKKTHE